MLQHFLEQKSQAVAVVELYVFQGVLAKKAEIKFWR